MPAKSFHFALLGALLLLSLLCCGNPTKHKSVDQQAVAYDWQPAITGLRQFPFELLEARFDDASGESICAMVPKTVIGDSSDWGAPGDVEILGEPEKPLPASLQLKWYDFREQQYYAGNFHFDRKALGKQFSAGFDNPYENGAHEPFRYFSIGIAPGGSVSVWLAGGSAAWRELAGHFVAKPQQAPAALLLGMTDGSFGDDPKRYALAKAAYLGPENSVPPDSAALRRWAETYEQRQQYRVQPASRGHVQVLNLTYFNGETRSYAGNELPARPWAQPLPQVIRVNWSDAPRASLAATTHAAYGFDEAEVIQAFRELGGAASPLELVVEISTIGNVVNCTLKNETQFYRFTKGRML